MGAHRQILATLARLDAVVDPSGLAAQLRELRPHVEAYLVNDDAFYPQLKALCEASGDTAGSHLVGIFESNMRVQAGGVRRFFLGLETMPLTQVSSSYKTVANLLRQRFDTEAKAIFPIHQRNLKVS